MLNYEQNQILEQAIILLFQLRDDQSIEHWEEQREREFLKNCLNNDRKANDEERGISFYFTEKEIKALPKK